MPESKKKLLLKSSILKQAFVIPSPIGSIGLWVKDHVLLRLAWIEKKEGAGLPLGVAALAAQRLAAYFHDPVTHFHDLPIAPAKTPFAARLRSLLWTLSPGETLTYAEAARRLKTSPRALGQSLAKNPLPIIIPCHRIVARDGEGGYMGRNQNPIKSWLLVHERR